METRPEVPRETEMVRFLPSTPKTPENSYNPSLLFSVFRHKVCILKGLLRNTDTSTCKLQSFVLVLNISTEVFWLVPI